MLFFCLCFINILSKDALLQLEQSRIQLEEMASLKAELLKLQAVSERNRILVETLRSQVVEGEKTMAEMQIEKEENEMKVVQFESEREELQIQISVLTGNVFLSFFMMMVYCTPLLALSSFFSSFYQPTLQPHSHLSLHLHLFSTSSHYPEYLTNMTV